MLHSANVDVNGYFLPRAADLADLGAWSSILPDKPRILRTNLFGDAFIVGADGYVHLLERAGCCAERVADSEEEFWHRVGNDDQGWLMTQLADDCHSSGLTLRDGQCYAFTVPPILGGEYIPQNVWVAPWSEWFSVTGDLFAQVKDLPDGETVSFKVVD